MSQAQTRSIQKNIQESTQTKEQKTKNLESVMEGIVQVVLGIYLLFMFLVYPLYLGDGYYYITDYKYKLYKYIHISFFIVALITIGILLAIKKKNDTLKPMRERLNKQFMYTDLWLLAYGFMLCISTLQSVNQQTALYGYQDWYMGFFMQGSFVILYYIFSRFFKYKDWYLHLFALVNTMICLFGYLQRLGINLLSDRGYHQGSAALSTIGNNNWICGFLSITLAIFVYLYMTGRPADHLIYGVGMFITFGFLALQGAESGWIILAAILLVTLFISFSQKSGAYAKLYLSMCSIIFGSIWIATGLYEKAQKSGIQIYDGDTSMAYKQVWLILFLGSLIACIIFHILLRKKDLYKFRMVFLFIVGIALFIGLLLGVLSMLLSTKGRYLPWVKEGGLLDFTITWGHDRGAIYRLAVKAFSESDGVSKMIGYGPDCFKYAIYEHGSAAFPGADQFLADYNTITNAHNEFLTLLLNIGVLGVITYFGLLISIVVRLCKQKKNIKYLGLSIIVIPFLHNMVSFQQIIATPYLFILLGIVEAGILVEEKKIKIRRKRKEKKI